MSGRFLKSMASFMKWIPSVRRFPEDVALVESINSVKERMVALTTESRANTKIMAAIQSNLFEQTQITAAISSKLTSQSAAIQSELTSQSTAIRSELTTQFAANRAESSKQSEGLTKMINRFQTEPSGAISNVARSENDKAIAAVLQYLEEEEGKTILDVHYGKKWGPPGEEVEVGCLIEMIDDIAIVEVNF